MYKNLVFYLVLFYVLFLGLLPKPVLAIAQSKNEYFTLQKRTQNSIEITPEYILANMSLEQKLGQVLILGLETKSLDEKLKSRIKNIQPGGFIFFSNNISTAQQLKKFTSDIQSLYLTQNLPLAFIAVDQEGGNVVRIKTKPWLPSAASLASYSQPDLAEKIFYDMSVYLKQLGFNMNLGPVLDLAHPDYNDFIGTRAFSKDSFTTTQFAGSIIQAQNQASIVSVAKHFPGHGGLKGDSHIKLPVVHSSKRELLEGALLPYKNLIEQGLLDAIMIGHLALPKIDKKSRAASFSPPIMKDLLRKELKFEGIAITDDLGMGATKNIKLFSDKASAALNAGADMLMIAWSWDEHEKLRDGLKHKIKNQEISIQELDQKVLRILKLKEKFALLSKPNVINTLAETNSTFEEEQNTFGSGNVQQNITLLSSPSNISLDPIQLENEFSPSGRRSPSSAENKDSNFSYVRNINELNKSILQQWDISHFLEHKNWLFVEKKLNISSALRPILKMHKLDSLALMPSLRSIDIEYHLRSRPESKILFHLDGKQSRKILFGVGKEYRKRILVMNTATPLNERQASHFFNVVNFKSKLVDLGGVLASYVLDVSKENFKSAKPESRISNEEAIASSR